MSNTNFWVLNSSMARKKSHPVEEAAVVVRTPADNISLALRKIDEEWDKEQAECSRVYNSAQESAWRRYVAALHSHTDNSFNDQFDAEREAALKTWRTNSLAADKKAEAAKQALLKKTPPLRNEND